jgi:hypothetical protein
MMMSRMMEVGHFTHFFALTFNPLS